MIIIMNLAFKYLYLKIHIVNFCGININSPVGVQVCLNGLYMVLHPQFPAEFPNVRICRGFSPYQARPTLKPNPD